MSHLFSEQANRNNAKKGAFTCTGSEFLTIAPVVLRYFKNVVQPRGLLAKEVASMIAALEVVELLQATRTGSVSPEQLSRAIFKHLDLCLASYGEEFCKPKHHYSMHLPDMLRRFGYLLSTFVQERKHRLVLRYGRDRKNLRSFDAGLIEDITCHQVWQLQQHFYFALTTAKPQGKFVFALQELFPNVAVHGMAILNAISVNGGKASSGDIVSFWDDGQMHLGELFFSVGVKSTEHVSFSFVSKWQASKADGSWVTFLLPSSETNVLKIECKCLDTVVTHRMAHDRKSCSVHLPPELRAES